MYAQQREQGYRLALEQGDRAFDADLLISDETSARAGWREWPTQTVPEHARRARLCA